VNNFTRLPPLLRKKEPPAPSVEQIADTKQTLKRDCLEARKKRGTAAFAVDRVHVFQANVRVLASAWFPP